MKSELGKCEHCGKITNTEIYRYCSGCRKELMEIWEKERAMEEREYRKNRL